MLRTLVGGLANGRYPTGGKLKNSPSHTVRTVVQVNKQEILSEQLKEIIADIKC